MKFLGYFLLVFAAFCAGFFVGVESMYRIAKDVIQGK